MRVIMLGPPGAGKGTQAGKLSEKLGAPHISTGNILRKDVREDTKLGQLAQSYMKAGKLVPDDVVIQMGAARLQEKDGGPLF